MNAAEALKDIQPYVDKLRAFLGTAPHDDPLYADIEESLRVRAAAAGASAAESAIEETALPSLHNFLKQH